MHISNANDSSRWVRLCVCVCVCARSSHTGKADQRAAESGERRRTQRGRVAPHHGIVLAARSHLTSVTLSSTVFGALVARRVDERNAHVRRVQHRRVVGTVADRAHNQTARLGVCVRVRVRVCARDNSDR